MTQMRRRFVWDIDWNLLRTFTIIVQEGSLTAAGDKLSLSQPTISNALRRLEDHMACRLVNRSSNYFRVTPAGETLMKSAW
ncbi:MAG: LysR family transcriptional regulator [Fimbriimonadaceae bacterium]|nr:LysR family transcriptional regulator [Alphaproteobacteria bacterium]